MNFKDKNSLKLLSWTTLETSEHLSKTDKKFCPGWISKDSLITKPLQSGHSKADIP